MIVKEAVKQIKRQQSNRQMEVVPLCLLNKVLFYFKATMKFIIFQIVTNYFFYQSFFIFFSESCCKYPNIDERCEFSITFFVLKKIIICTICVLNEIEENLRYILIIQTEIVYFHQRGILPGTTAVWVTS